MNRKLTSLERNQRLDANLNLGKQGLDVGGQGENGLELSVREQVGIDDKAVEERDAVLDEDAEVNLEIDDGLDQGLDVDVNLGGKLGYMVVSSGLQL